MRWLLVFIWLVLAFFVLVGFSSIDPNLNQFQRLPQSVRLKRLYNAGIDLYNRRRYEDAIAVFEAVEKLSYKDVYAKFWKKKCEERLFQEKNEALKTKIIQKHGSLQEKELLYDNWVWGPTVGHFEIRVSKPKPYIPPVKKIRPRATDVEIEKAVEAAKSEDPVALFELAMLYNSRGEKIEAIAALERAVIQDPEVMAQYDEGLTGAIEEQTQKGLESGTIIPDERLLAARVAFLQGEFYASTIHFIKAASRDDSLIKRAQEGLSKILDSGHCDFLQNPPDVESFFQAYVFEENEDRVYLNIQYQPMSPIFMVPFNLSFENQMVKSVEILSPDILCAFTDPLQFATEPIRLWVVGKDLGDEIPTFKLKAILHLDSNKTKYLELSNFITRRDVADNWSAIIGPPESFSSVFAGPNYDKVEKGVAIKGYSLQLSDGKGPLVALDPFRKPLPHSVNVWNSMEDIRQGNP